MVKLLNLSPILNATWASPKPSGKTPDPRGTSLSAKS